MSNAFTRAPSPAITTCALTHIARAPIDIARAMAQHAAYEQALREAGLAVERLPDLPESPDGVFVEDTAVLLGGHAVVTRPGSAARLLETESTAVALAAGFEVWRLPVGRMDGGDILRVGRTLFAGQSTRTDVAGTAALAAFAAPLGYDVVPVPVHGCLHLKTAATWLGPDGAGQGRLLLNPAWIDATPFAALTFIEVTPEEPWAANTLRIGNVLLLAAGNPRTASQLAALGYAIRVLDISELQKAEAGLTCMSLIG